jgi:hypothetical protein
VYLKPRNQRISQRCHQANEIFWCAAIVAPDSASQHHHHPLFGHHHRRSRLWHLLNLCLAPGTAKTPAPPQAAARHPALPPTPVLPRAAAQPPALPSSVTVAGAAPDSASWHLWCLCCPKLPQASRAAAAPRCCFGN